MVYKRVFQCDVCGKYEDDKNDANPYAEWHGTIIYPNGWSFVGGYTTITSLCCSRACAETALNKIYKD